MPQRTDPGMPGTAPQVGGFALIKRYFLDFKVLGDNPLEFWTIQIVNLLDSIAYFAMISIITLFLGPEGTLGFSETNTGYVVTGFTSFVTISLFVSGFVTDSLGIKKSLVIAQGINVIARFGILFLGLTPSVPFRGVLVVALLVLSAPGMAMTQTVFQSAIARFSSRRSRSASFNIWYLVMNVGAMVGGLSVDVVRKTLGLDVTWIFGMGAVCAVLSVVAAFVMIRKVAQVVVPGEEPDVEDPNAPKKGGRQIFKEIIGQSAFWRFIVLMTSLLGVRAVFTYMYLLMPMYWVRVIEDVTGEKTNQGFLQALNPILIVTGLILFIPIANKFNVFKMLVFGAVISSFSLLVMVAPNAWFAPITTFFGLAPAENHALMTAQSYFVMSAVMLIVLSIGEIIWSPKLTEYTAAIAPKGQEGSYLGMSMMPWFVAKTVVGLISGHMIARWVPEGIGDRIVNGDVSFWDRPEAMWIILFCWAVLGPVMAWIFRGWLTRGSEEALAAKA